MKLDTNSIAHTKWECKYHIVFAPKYRRQIIYGKIDRAAIRESLFERVRKCYGKLDHHRPNTKQS